MADNYLTAAKHILHARARPMTAQEILYDARRHGLLPGHLSGRTMQKTLQARIAEDIFSNRSRSIFYRTNIGRYYLRELSEDGTLPKQKLLEFDASARRARAPTCRLLYARIEDPPENLTIYPYRYEISGDKTAYNYQLDAPVGHFSILTLTIIMWKGMVLLHKDGNYSFFKRDDDCISGGFRRYVDEYDIDLFGKDSVGADISALRECARFLGSRPECLDFESRLVATCVDPAARSVTFGVKVEVRSNSEYDGSVQRRLDVKQVHWEATPAALQQKIDPVSLALLDVASR